MNASYKSSAISQAGAGFYTIGAGASRRREFLPAPGTARHERPAAAAPLAAITSALPPAGAAATRAAVRPVYAGDRLLPTPELSPRTYNALLRSHITTIGQFCALELHELQWRRSFGKKAIAEAVAYRERLGVPLT